VSGWIGECVEGWDRLVRCACRWAPRRIAGPG